MAKLIIKIPLEGPERHAADLAQGAFGNEVATSTAAGNSYTSGGSLDELVSEVLIEAGINVGESAFEFEIEQDPS